MMNKNISISINLIKTALSWEGLWCLGRGVHSIGTFSLCLLAVTLQFPLTGPRQNESMMRRACVLL